MVEHEPYRTDLPLYLTGDLSTEQTAGLEEHLAECASCRRVLDEQRAALEQLRRVGRAGDADADLAGFFEDRIAPALQRRSMFRKPFLRAAALIVAFLAGIAVDRIVLRRSPDSGGPVVTQSPEAQSEKLYRAYLATEGSQSGLARALIALSIVSQ